MIGMVIMSIILTNHRPLLKDTIDMYKISRNCDQFSMTVPNLNIKMIERLKECSHCVL